MLLETSFHNLVLFILYEKQTENRKEPNSAYLQLLVFIPPTIPLAAVVFPALSRPTKRSVTDLQKCIDIVKHVIKKKISSLKLVIINCSI